LPAELRNQIYAYVTFEGSLTYAYGSWAKEIEIASLASKFDSNERYDHAVQICQPDVDFLSTCRQIMEEAAPLFYNLNSFHFADGDDFIHFLPELAVMHKFVTMLRIEMKAQMILEAMGDIAAMRLPNLEKVEIVLSRKHIELGFRAGWSASYEDYMSFLQCQYRAWLRQCIKGPFEVSFMPQKRYRTLSSNDRCAGSKGVRIQIG
jgi:hypothetical protein